MIQMHINNNIVTLEDKLNKNQKPVIKTDQRANYFPVLLEHLSPADTWYATLTTDMLTD